MQRLITEEGYTISDIRDYDEVADTGSNRHLGVEHRVLGRKISRARLVTELYHSISKLVIDALVPDANGRYRLETNDDTRQNPHRSTFETLHHVFCNITEVPTCVLVTPLAVGTHWQPIIPQHVVHEVQVKY